MNIAELAARDGWSWKSQEQQIVRGPCPICGSGTATIRLLVDRLIGFCSSGCKKEELLESFGKAEAPLGPVHSGAAAPSLNVLPAAGPSTNGNGKVHHPDVRTWKVLAFRIGQQFFFKTAKPAINPQPDVLIAQLSTDLMAGVDAGILNPLPDLSRTDLMDEIEIVAGAVVDDYFEKHPTAAASQVPAIRDAVQLPDVIEIDWEDHATALIANQEYLTHRPIVEGLCYAKTASLLVGGKHSGKTTNARTIAMSVCRKWPVFGRGTMQGPVLYCASEDEILVVRAELLRMGWCPNDPLSLMKIGSKTVSEPERLLDAIAVYAKAKGAILIVLDMLFDFAMIKDEMSYAGTRAASSPVYDLAMRTDAHVLATHHSPKYMSGGASAETAALGSQGVAARFTPIILSRHWGGDLYTIESTPPRDPRGKPLEPVCITLDANGMAIAGELFKDSMRWRVLAPKVMDFIETVDPGQHHTVTALSEGLEINRPMMQTVLYNLCREGKLQREKKGRSYKYFLAQTQADMWTPKD